MGDRHHKPDTIRCGCGVFYGFGRHHSGGFRRLTTPMLHQGLRHHSPTPQGEAVVAVPSSDRHHDGGLAADSPYSTTNQINQHQIKYFVNTIDVTTMHGKYKQEIGSFIGSTAAVVAILPSTARHGGGNGWKSRRCCCCGGCGGGVAAVVGDGSGGAVIGVVLTKWRERRCKGEGGGGDGAATVVRVKMMVVIRVAAEVGVVVCVGCDDYDDGVVGVVAVVGRDGGLEVRRLTEAWPESGRKKGREKWRLP
nr:hypothetical protein [Tanacetum cinerariifolium]